MILVLAKWGISPNTIYDKSHVSANVSDQMARSWLLSSTPSHLPLLPCIGDCTTWADRWWVTFVCPLSPNVTQVAPFNFKVWFSSHQHGLLLNGAQTKQCAGFKMEGWGSTFQRNGGYVQAGWNRWTKVTCVTCGKESQHEWKKRLTKHWWKWTCVILYSSEAAVHSEWPLAGLQRWRYNNQFAVPCLLQAC